MIKQTGKKIEVDEVVRGCDFCHRTIDAGADNMGGLECSSVMDFDFGYFSNRDGEHWQWELCHECAHKADGLLKALKDNIASGAV